MKIHFDYKREGDKNYVKHSLVIFIDDELYANYESRNKTDLSGPVYKLYERLGLDAKPVFDGVNFPDCEVSEKELRLLTGQMSDFRIWKKKN